MTYSMTLPQPAPDGIESPLEVLIKKENYGIYLCTSDNDQYRLVVPHLLGHGLPYKGRLSIDTKVADGTRLIIIYGSEGDILRLRPPRNSINFIIADESDFERLRYDYRLAGVAKKGNLGSLVPELFRFFNARLKQHAMSSEIIQGSPSSDTQVTQLVFARRMRYLGILVELNEAMSFNEVGEIESAQRLLRDSECRLGALLQGGDSALRGIHEYVGEFTHQLFADSGGKRIMFLKGFKDESRATVEQTVYSVLDEEQKTRRKALALARSDGLISHGRIDIPTDRSLDTLVDGSMKIRDVLYYSHVPLVNIPKFFPPISHGLFMKRYQFMEGIGVTGLQGDLSLSDTESFNMLNILTEMNIRSPDTDFSRFVAEFKRVVDFQKSEFLAYIQHLDLDAHLHQAPEITDFSLDFLQNTAKIAAKLGLSLDRKRVEPYSALIFRDINVEGINHVRVRDSNWKNMMIDPDEQVFSIAHLVDVMFEKYGTSHNIWSLRSGYFNQIMRIDFDKMNRVSHRFEDVVKDSFGVLDLSPAEKKRSFYLDLLLSAKFEALKYLKAGSDNYQLIQDINRRIENMRGRHVEKLDDTYLQRVTQFLIHNNLLGYATESDCLMDAERMRVYRDSRSGAHITEYLDERRGSDKVRLLAGIGYHIKEVETALLFLKQKFLDAGNRDAVEATEYMKGIYTCFKAKLTSLTREVQR